MSRFLGALPPLLLAATLSAQTADLAVTLEVPDTVQGGATFTYRATVTNKGPDAASDVVLYLGSALYPCYDQVPLEPIAAGETRTFACSITVRTPPYFIDLGVNVWVSNERDYSDNARQNLVTIMTGPDLAVWQPSQPVTTPGVAYRQNITYHNLANAPATGVTVTVTAPATIIAAPDYCQVDGARAVCTIGSLPVGGRGFFNLDVVAPDISEHTFTLTASIAGNEPDANPADNSASFDARTYRTFFVTNTADAGSGSLRAALEGANTCGRDYPCLVAFRIPNAGQQWHTIRVESPLPRVTAGNLVIDGITQVHYFGDTNPLGPEIELTGSANAGNGLEMYVACDAVVRGLAINGFPGAGVDIGGSAQCPSFNRGLHQSYIGVDPTGARAVPNERGVSVLLHGALPWHFTKNVISGNRRSGIFIEEGANLRIRENVIGLNATATAPLGNGASGVYIAQGGGGTDLINNHLSFNAHFGVAIVRGTQNVAFLGNSFQANHQQAIDWGLDGVPSEQEVSIPEITSVRYENGVTIIEGVAAISATFVNVNLYANDAPDPSGYGEGQYFLGVTSANPGGGKFTFRHPHDLRGKWVAATKTQINYYGFLRAQGTDHLAFSTTSEFSRAVEVR